MWAWLKSLFQRAKPDVEPGAGPDTGTDTGADLEPVSGPDGEQAAASQKSSNDLVRKHLLEHGDDGHRVRHVIHFALPGDADPVVSKAELKEILASDAITFTDTDDSAGVVFEMYREVASADFDAMTEAFATHLASLGWKYDGWECAVETGDS